MAQTLTLATGTCSIPLYVYKFEPFSGSGLLKPARCAT
jgi:hypothetical protein